MAYLCIRLIRRTTSDGSVNEVGDIISYFDDSWVDNGGDFGRIGRRNFAWIRCQDIPTDILAGLLTPDIYSAGATGKRRRFSVNSKVIGNFDDQHANYVKKSFVRGVEVPESDVISVPWSSLFEAIVDKRSGSKATLDDILQHKIIEGIASDSASVR